MHEKYGLDDVYAARSAHEVHDEESAQEEHYQQVLEHMQARLMVKRAHYEKRLVRMRSNLIAVAEQTRLMSLKLGHAEGSKMRSETKLATTRKAADEARVEHQVAKEELRAQLRAGAKAPRPETPPPDLPEGMSGRELQALANERSEASALEQLQKAAQPVDDGRRPDSTPAAKLRYYEGIWERLAALTGSDCDMPTDSAMRWKSLGSLPLQRLANMISAPSSSSESGVASASR